MALHDLVDIVEFVVGDGANEPTPCVAVSVQHDPGVLDRADRLDRPRLEVARRQARRLIGHEFAATKLSHDHLLRSSKMGNIAQLEKLRPESRA
jgi:hypothetical protein